MSTTTLFLYILAFGLWALAVRHEGGIGIGIRFLYGFNVTLFFLVGPMLEEVIGSPLNRFRSPAFQSAVELSALALLAYVVGAYLVYPRLTGRSRLTTPQYQERMKNPQRLNEQWAIAWTLIVVGAVSLPLFAAIRQIPTLGAVFGQVPRLTDTGFVMLALYAHYSGRRRVLVAVAAVFLVRGIIFSAISGHAGSLFLNGTFVACVAVASSRLRISSVALLIGGAVVLLIPAQMWMNNRDRLREAVQSGRGFDERAQIAISIFFESQSAPSADTDLVASYRQRGDFTDLLAQGLNHTPAVEPFAHGDTFLQAFVAAVPRFLWPDKPYHAGGNEFVSRYTGTRFGENTSVAMNYLFEFYVNFGYTGVLLGMFGLGLLLGWLESLYYRRGSGDLFFEFCLIHCAWSICLYCDTAALLAMTIPPGLALCLGVRGFLQKMIPSKYLPQWAPSAPNLKQPASDHRGLTRRT